MIKGRLAKSLWSIAICGLCLIVTVRVFEWKYVFASLEAIDFAQLTLRCAPLLVIIYFIRALRWVVIAGLPFTLRTIGETYLYVTVSIALAMVTPFQIGEAAKIALARRLSDLDVASGAPAFIVERLMDVVVLTMLFAATGLIRPEAKWIALGLPVTGIALFCIWLAPFAARRWGLSGWLRYIDRASIAGPRFLGATALSIVSWCATALLWSVALAAVGVVLPVEGLVTLLFGVTASVIASLTPSGLGVAELSVHAILVSYGLSPNVADSAAIVIRLLTILAVIIGALHGVLLFLLLRSTERTRIAQATPLSGEP